jgi:hypothetical protein
VSVVHAADTDIVVATLDAEVQALCSQVRLLVDYIRLHSAGTREATLREA